MFKVRSSWLTVIIILVGCSDQTIDQTGSSSGSAESKAIEAAELLVTVGEAEADVNDRLTEGETYMRINAQKPNVRVLESGLQFEILEQGDGRSPGPKSNVVTHYHGTFINGDVFDSSIERGEPATFPVNRVIKGWTQALQMMKEGDVWRLTIPAHLAYGKRGVGQTIPPDTVLVFEVELIEVKD